MEDGQEPTLGEKEAKLEDEVRAARDAALEQSAEIQRRLDSRLLEIESRGARELGKRRAQEAKELKESLSGGDMAKGTGVGVSVAYAIIGLPLVGYGLGWLADRGTDSNVFGIVGFCVGGAFGVWFAMVQVKRM